MNSERSRARERAKAWRAKVEEIFDGKVCEKCGKEEALMISRDKGMPAGVPSVICVSCLYGNLRDERQGELCPVCKKGRLAGRTMCWDCFIKTEEGKRILVQQETGR